MYRGINRTWEKMFYCQEFIELQITLVNKRLWQWHAHAFVMTRLCYLCMYLRDRQLLSVDSWWLFLCMYVTLRLSIKHYLLTYLLTYLGYVASVCVCVCVWRRTCQLVTCSLTSTMSVSWRRSVRRVDLTNTLTPSLITYVTYNAA